MGNQSLRYCKNLVFGKQTEGLLLQLVGPSGLGIDRAKQLCVPRVWLVHILGYVVDVVCFVVKPLGDGEGAFPSRSKLVRSFLVHLEHKVSFLKHSASDISGMESTQVLLIDGQPDQSHLTFLLQKINCVLGCLFCFSF